MNKGHGKVLSVHRQGKQSPWPPPPRPSRKLTTYSWSVYLGFPLWAHWSTRVGTWRPQRNPSLQILFGRQRSTVFQMSKMSEWTNCRLLGVHGRWDAPRTRRIFSVTRGGDWSPIPGITPSYSQRSEFPFSKIWCCQALSAASSALASSFITLWKETSQPHFDFDLTLSSNNGVGEADSLFWTGRVTFRLTGMVQRVFCSLDLEFPV